MSVLCNLPDRKKWLEGFADEMERIEKKVPLNFLPADLKYPKWVENVEREMSLVLLPAAKLRQNQPEMTPKRMGAVLGHECAMMVWLQEYLLQASELPTEAIAEEQEQEAQKAVGKFSEWYDATRTMAKNALASCVDQTYEDMSAFLLGFSDGFSRKPKSFGTGDLGNTTFNIYLFMLMLWRQVECLKSVPELHQMLIRILGAHRVGDLKRIEKICQRIGLSFRKPGRPVKS